MFKIKIDFHLQLKATKNLPKVTKNKVTIFMPAVFYTNRVLKLSYRFAGQVDQLNVIFGVMFDTWVFHDRPVWRISVR